MVRAVHRRALPITDIPSVVWLLGLCCLLNVGGLSFLWPVNAIYIHMGLHKSMAVAGIVLMVFSGTGLLGSFLGGWLYDRIGASKVLILSLVVGCLSILLPAFTANFAVYVGVMGVFGTACAIPFPVLNAAAGHVWPAGGRRAFNFLYVSNNLGVAIGTALGGTLAAISFHAVFYAIAIGYVVLLLLVCTVLRRPFAALQGDLRRKQHDAENQQVIRTPMPWGGIGVLFLGYILAWAVYVQWQSSVSVYMQSTGYPLSAYSLLWTLNGILIFVSQPLVSFVTKRVSSLTVHMVGGTILFSISFVTLLFAHDYAMYVLAMVLTTLGEIFVWPAIPAAVAQITPSHRLGMLQGLVGSCATGGRMIGPVFGGVLYDHGSLHLVLLVSIGISIAPILLFMLYQRVTMPKSGELRPGIRA